MDHIKRQGVAGQVKRFCKRFAQGAGYAGVNLQVQRLIKCQEIPIVNWFDAL